VVHTVDQTRGRTRGRRLIRDRSRRSTETLARAASIGAGVILLLASVAAGPVVAASCKGSSHAAPVLTAGKASPGTGTPATTITFSVRYKDAANCAPTSITVSIVGGGTYAMSGPGSGFAGGVTFVVSRALPPGTWDYNFSATSGTGAGEKTGVLTKTTPNRVVITAPTPPPTPKPTPKPTPAPTPKPTPKPPPPPTPRPTPPPKPAATPAPTHKTAPVATPVPTSAPVASTGSPSPGSSDGAAPSPTDGLVGGGTAFGGSGPGDGDGRGDGDGLAPTPPVYGPSAPYALRFGHDSGPGTVAVGLVSAATSVLALGVLGAAARRRRRDNVALAVEAVAAAPVAAAPPPPLPPPPDPNAPAPWQTLTGRAPARFDGAAKGGAERRTISYRFVRLSDGPDDLRSREIGRLDRGDEVEVIGEHEGMLQVRTATGILGWVPRVVIVG
jgi:outer membrane biosynthesis protein TonB